MAGFAIRVKFVTPFGEGFSGCCEIAAGPRIDDFLKNWPSVPLTKVAAGGIKLNGDAATVYDGLKDGDRLAVAIPSIRGEAQLPEVRAVEKFLRNRNLYGTPGKGDHVVWAGAGGVKLTVNPQRGNRRRYIDGATLAALKSVFGKEEITKAFGRRNAE
jgi:hypothetical protein